MKFRQSTASGQTWQRKGFPATASARVLNPAITLTWLTTTLIFCQAIEAQSPGSNQAVSALGRLEPEGGTIHLVASSTPQSIMGGIVAELHVEEGDSVSTGQLLATLDTAEVMEAVVAEAEAALQFALREVEAARSQVEEACVRADVARREADRRKSLLERGLAGEEEAESSQGEAEALGASCKATRSIVRSAEAKSEVARAHVTQARAELKRAYLFSPINGTVLDIHAHPGEFINLEGAMTLGNTARMVAIAEVYETDIHRVKEGQTATVSSPALGGELSGTVQNIQLMVAKQDLLGTDPAARKDARIIEVEILLDDPGPASRLTHLQVDVVIHPGTD
jgi:HlyD family secretion protein